MKTLKKYGKTLGLSFLFLFFLAICIALLNTFQILFTKGSDIVLFIAMILTLFVIGFNFGKKAEKKGYLEGLKIGIVFIFFLLLINFLFYRTGFSLERLIYYLVLILSSVLGSMVGINKKH